MAGPRFSTEKTSTQQPEPRKRQDENASSVVARLLKGFGFLFIVTGAFYLFSLWERGLEEAALYVAISGAVVGLLFIGFGTVISILEDIRASLRSYPQDGRGLLRQTNQNADIKDDDISSPQHRGGT
jgi:hypothetical protein